MQCSYERLWHEPVIDHAYMDTYTSLNNACTYPGCTSSWPNCLSKVSDGWQRWYYNVFIVLVKSQPGADSNLSIGYSGLKPAWLLPAHEQLHWVMKTHGNVCQCKAETLGWQGSWRQGCSRMSNWAPCLQQINIELTVNKHSWVWEMDPFQRVSKWFWKKIIKRRLRLKWQSS